MNTNYVMRLVNCGVGPLTDSTPKLVAPSCLLGELKRELLSLYWSCNGLSAFGGALQVFPAGDRGSLWSVDEWNDDFRWRDAYRELADGCLFFAQDVFGGQFCVREAEVFRFHPETAELEFIGSSLEDWAGYVLDDPAETTGFPLKELWETVNGPLDARHRLVPKIPFVLGGAFDHMNLIAVNTVTAMRFYGDLAYQLHTVPDGSKVTLRVIE
jgi:hypothetical protein